MISDSENDIIRSNSSEKSDDETNFSSDSIPTKSISETSSETNSSTQESSSEVSQEIPSQQRQASHSPELISRMDEENYVPKIGRPRLYTPAQLRKKRAEYHKQWRERKARERQMEASRFLEMQREIERLKTNPVMEKSSYFLDCVHSDDMLEQKEITTIDGLKNILDKLCDGVLETVNKRSSLVSIINSMGDALIKNGALKRFSLS